MRRNRRQAVDDNGAPALTDDTGLPPLAGNNGLGPGGEIPQIEGNQLESLSDKDLLSIGEECEDWPVQKVCTFIVLRSIRIQYSSMNIAYSILLHIDILLSDVELIKGSTYLCNAY